jgi:hypothetical protein
MTILTTGQRIKITADCRTVDGRVRFASKNGRSLWLSFDALIDGHVGEMPVMQDDAGDYRSLLTGKPIGIVPVGAGA